MSAAALREPARTADVARHYLRLLGSERAAVAFVLVVMFAVLFSMNSSGFQGLAATIWLMQYLPLLQWGLADCRGGLDEAMPLGQVRHDLVRVACGAVWAAAALAVALALVALLFYGRFHGRSGAGFWGSPPLLVAVGVACYLFGAAAWLHGASGGHPRPAAYAFGILPLVLLGVSWSRLERLVSLREAPAAGQALAWVGLAALWLGSGAGAAWLSASAPRWLPGLRMRVTGANRGNGAAVAAGPAGGAPGAFYPAGAVAEPRRRAPLHRVLWRAVVLLTPMLGVAVFVAVATLLFIAATDGPEASRGEKLMFLLTYLLPLWWPAAVWGFGARPPQRRVEPIPVGAVTQQLIRLAAGAVWLEVMLLLMLAALAVGIGESVPPLDPGNVASWAAIPAGALLLYLLASLPALLAVEYRIGWFLGWIAFLLPALPILRATLPHGRFSLGSALSVYSLKTYPWADAMLLWIPVFTAVAVLAAAWGVALERSGPSRPAT